MGLSISNALNIIFSEALNNDFKGKSVLMLGKLKIFHNKIDLCAFAYKLGVKLNYSEIKTVGGGLVDSYSFFKNLGFSEVHAMDISDYENADIIFDLNKQVPNELKNKFDYIVDGGTTEHVFDYRQALFNIATMLKVGGKVLHTIPGGGSSINHGYYTLSPSLLSDFYSSNGFQVEHLNISMKKNNFSWNHNRQINSITDILLTMPDYRIFNLRDSEILPEYRGTLICIAKKIKQQDEIINPIQRQWYGLANIELLREMWTTDLNLKQDNIRIGVFGLGLTAQKFFNVIKDCEGFTSNKIKAVYTYENPDSLTSFNGYPIIDAKNLSPNDIDILFVAVAKKSTDKEIFNKLKWIKNSGVKLIRFNDYFNVFSFY